MMIIKVPRVMAMRISKIDEGVTFGGKIILEFGIRGRIGVDVW